MKMKKNLLLIIALCSCIIVKSQTVTYEKMFVDIHDFNFHNDIEMPTCMLQLQNGSFVLAGIEGARATIYKTDALGNLLWRQSFPSNFQIPYSIFSSIRSTNDGGFILTGTSSDTLNSSLNDLVL